MGNGEGGWDESCRGRGGWLEDPRVGLRPGEHVRFRAGLKFAPDLADGHDLTGVYVSLKEPPEGREDVRVVPLQLANATGVDDMDHAATARRNRLSSSSTCLRLTPIDRKCTRLHSSH